MVNQMYAQYIELLDALQKAANENDNLRKLTPAEYNAEFIKEYTPFSFISLNDTDKRNIIGGIMLGAMIDVVFFKIFLRQVRFFNITFIPLVLLKISSVFLERVVNYNLTQVKQDNIPRLDTAKELSPDQEKHLNNYLKFLNLTKHTVAREIFNKSLPGYIFIRINANITSIVLLIFFIPVKKQQISLSHIIFLPIILSTISLWEYLVYKSCQQHKIIDEEHKNLLKDVLLPSSNASPSNDNIPTSPQTSPKDEEPNNSLKGVLLPPSNVSPNNDNVPTSSRGCHYVI